MVYLGSLANKELFQAWTQDKCVPLVKILFLLHLFNFFLNYLNDLIEKSLSE